MTFAEVWERGDAISREKAIDELTAAVCWKSPAIGFASLHVEACFRMKSSSDS